MKMPWRSLPSLRAPSFRLFRNAAFGLCAGVLFGCVGRAAENPVLALVRAHAHNDYEHTRPLLDALEQGFCSIEADVWLVDGELRVAHDLKDARPRRTLEKLYLDPLSARTKENGGRVFPGGPPVLLLVDVKSDATNTYRVLRSVLQRYQSMLTRFESNRTVTNAVSVVVSGNRTLEWMSRDRVRLAAYDGRLADLEEGNVSPHLIPLISDNWAMHFRWRGRAEDGALPAEERVKLRELVERAHRQGRLMRWWGTADTRVVWQELFEAGVDLINTDDLTGLAGYLRSRR
jgi:glycerophosphoryl diester phosphodiesterase